MSTNYNMQNYANDIVAALKDTCIRTGIQPPVIVSESGRAIVSSSAALVFEVIETEPRGARGVARLLLGRMLIKLSWKLSTLSEVQKQFLDRRVTHDGTGCILAAQFS